MRNQRQLECIQAISEKDYNCYIQACVGFGKTVMIQRVLHRMYLEGKLNKGAKILFQTSATTLLNSFLEEVKICEELFGFNITELFQITTACYQSRLTTKKEFDFIVNDEFDFCGSVYAEDLSNCKTPMICMSGTLSDLNTFEFKGTEITKVEWIEQKLPCAFKYTIKDGIRDGIVVNFETTLIMHELSPTLKYGKIWKNQKWEMPESKFYEKCIEQTMKFRFFNEAQVRKELEDKVGTVNPNRIKDKNVITLLRRMKFPQAYVEGKLITEQTKFNTMRNLYGQKATKLVQNTPSKIAPLRQLLKKLKGRTIVWGPQLDYLKLLMGEERVLTDSNPILSDFNNHLIDQIGTSKKIERGVTPDHVDNLVLVCPIGSNPKLEQLIGRVIRTDTREDKIAKLFICVTENTYADNWLRRGCKQKDSYLDLNIKNTIRI